MAVIQESGNARSAREIESYLVDMTDTPLVDPSSPEGAALSDLAYGLCEPVVRNTVVHSGS